MDKIALCGDCNDRYFQFLRNSQRITSISNAAPAEMARIALASWSDFFNGATVAEVTPARQREFCRMVEGSPHTTVVRWIYEARPDRGQVGTESRLQRGRD